MTIEITVLSKQNTLDIGNKHWLFQQNSNEVTEVLSEANQQGAVL